MCQREMTFDELVEVIKGLKSLLRQALPSVEYEIDGWKTAKEDGDIDYGGIPRLTKLAKQIREVVG